MTRKLFCLTILSMVLLSSLQLGCSSTPAEVIPTSAEMSPMDTELPATPTEPPPTPTEVPPTPYPMLSIVWSDDFEDGDYAGWEEYGSTGFYYVNEGALTVGPEMTGDIVHRTEVAHGAWSFDVFISDQIKALNRIGIMYEEEGIYGLGILIRTEQNTVINFFQTENGEESVVGTFEKQDQISGWNHFDITRDEAGHSIVYLNGEPVLEYKDELSITPYWFYFSGPIGSALDNVVVRAFGPAAMAEPTEAPPPEAPEKECPDGVVTVNVHDWSWLDMEVYWNDVIAAFNEAHHCIQAEEVELSFDRDVELKKISDGNAPDLVGLDSSDIPQVYLLGALLDLTPFYEADEEFNPDEEFYESVWKAGWVQGVPVAIAKDYSTSAFYVNTDHFKRAGIDIPEEGWTYDEFVQIAQQLTLDANGNNATSPEFDPENVVQWGASIPYWGGDTGWWRGFQSFLYSFGAHTISDDGTTTNGYINSPAAVAAWEWYKAFVHSSGAVPNTTYMAATNLSNEQMLSDGKLAIVSSYWGPWYEEISNQASDLNCAVVPLPTGPGGHEAAIMWMGWGINANSEHPEEAWQLLKWLTTEPGQGFFAQDALTGHISTAEELQKVDDPYWGVFLAEVPYQGRLDDMTTPFYTTCVDIPGGELLGRLFMEGGAEMDIRAELDAFMIEADKCLAESTIE